MVADPTYHMVGETVLTSKGSVGPGFTVFRVLQA
jgi:hypothetical protein